MVQVFSVDFEDEEKNRLLITVPLNDLRELFCVMALGLDDPNFSYPSFTFHLHLS